ncbi:hypothetical protein O181_087632 [Austropuccinia psidii MF-1]|uniref:Uncharacterized protein n=1 Tax=Austropuccinia psidii MF-1 TaxID=1389203 RepID=A0A9Q3IQ12_9BASI|nr:hypothetical protein [Austropuccinia psidii MF-1]
MWQGGPMLEGLFPLVVDAEGSAKLDGEEVEVLNPFIGNHSGTSPSKPSSKRFQSQVIPRTPQNSHPVLSTIPSSIPPPSLNPSTSRVALASPLRPSPITQPRKSPIFTSQQLQPVASSSRRREDLFAFLFPAAQLFQIMESWPVQVTREDPNGKMKDKMMWPDFLEGVIEKVGR